jgi:hypothetical protein
MFPGRERLGIFIFRQGLTQHLQVIGIYICEYISHYAPNAIMPAGLVMAASLL